MPANVIAALPKDLKPPIEAHRRLTASSRNALILWEMVARETLQQIEYDFLAIRVLYFLVFLLSPKRHLLTKRCKIRRFALENDWLR
jgi:hypothetical protein